MKIEHHYIIDGVAYEVCAFKDATLHIYDNAVVNPGDVKSYSRSNPPLPIKPVNPPITLETLPGELEKLGFENTEESDSNGRTIELKRASSDGSIAKYRCEVWVSHLGATVAMIQSLGDTFHEVDVLFTNPDDALTLVKLLVEGANS